MTVLHAGQVCIFEFKVVHTVATGEALRQIRARGAMPTSTAIAASRAT